MAARVGDDIKPLEASAVVEGRWFLQTRSGGKQSTFCMITTFILALPVRPVLRSAPRNPL
jgi:hypothetical protein